MCEKGRRNLKLFSNTVELRVSYLSFFVWVILSTKLYGIYWSTVTFAFSAFWNYFLVVCLVS